MRSSQIFRAILSASIVLASAPAAARAPAGKAAPAEEDSEAKQLFNARKYPEAALAFEQLYAASPVPKHLFNAAMARELAGHEGHAYLLLRRYLALPELQPAEVTRANDRLLALQRRTAAVRLVTLPDTLAANNLQIALERTPTGAVGDAGRVPLALEGEILKQLVSLDVAGAFDLFLEPGPWVATARADGHETVRQEFTVDTSQAMVSLTLPELPPPAVAVTATFGPPEALAGGIEVTITREGEPPRTEVVRESPVTWQLAPGTYQFSARAPGHVPQQLEFSVADAPDALPAITLAPEAVAVPVEPKPNKPQPDPWAIALGVAGGGTAVLGAVVLGVGASRWSKTLDRYEQYAGTDPTNWNVASGNLKTSWTNYAAGAGLLGAGVGLGLGALGHQFAHRLDHPRRFWAAATGLGGVLAIGGALLVGRAGVGFQSTQWSHAEGFDALDGAAAREAISNKNHDIGSTAALLGFGAGLALSGVLGLVRKPSPAPQRASVLPTGTGVVLSGRF